MSNTKKTLANAWRATQGNTPGMAQQSATKLQQSQARKNAQLDRITNQINRSQTKRNR